MTPNCKLALLILALTLDGQVHTGKIIHGNKVAPHQRPYMVFVENHKHGQSKTSCSGFLLDESFVMTAAHCHAHSHTVIMGSHRISENAEVMNVEKAFPHPGFNITDCSDDLLLLKLSCKATFSKNVGPIDLATDNGGSLPQSCSVSGWGSTSQNNGYASRVLMEANVTIIESDKCQKAKSYCSEGETGPASGDSGGPLVCEDGKAYGVVSSTKTTTDGQLIKSYVKISDYRSWIDMIMNNTGKP
ncbi:granzyme E [Xyrichtys novacula]|uniref:trypsin n=1 Tax=Xyrichtys novacula TaxID=13765 RepID=A0AAV1FH10_XYRNO|nr:granzyme E [Xyrichtys novacula]